MTSPETVWYIFKPACFELVQNLDISSFLSEDCAAYTISKILGYLIIIGSVFLKLPQIWKIYECKTSKGISELSLLIQSFGLMTTSAYFYRKELPMSTYMELPIISIQNWIVFMFIFYYSGQLMSVSRICFLIGFVLFGYLLTTTLVPMVIIEYVFSAQVFIICGSRFPQIYENYSSKSTGALSFITITLTFFGSTARLFTILQEVSDRMVAVVTLLSWSLNAILWSQFFVYWNSNLLDDKSAELKGGEKKAKKKRKKAKKIQ